MLLRVGLVLLLDPRCGSSRMKGSQRLWGIFVPGFALSFHAHWAAGALAASVFFACQTSAADRLILRNLDILTDRTVTALDEDGLTPH